MCIFRDIPPKPSSEWHSTASGVSNFSPGSSSLQKLLGFIEDSARFFGCQFVLSSHSPFFLAAQGARIYNLDETPPIPQKWTELPNVRAYFELFDKHREEF